MAFRGHILILPASGECYFAFMPRWFNTAGPCRPERHYMLPAMRRLPQVRRLIDQESYFVVHAPRQIGKTTALLSLAQELTAEGLNLAGVQKVLELEADLAELRRQLADVRDSAEAAIANAHRQYRRDLVPVKQAVTLFRKP